LGPIFRTGSVSIFVDQHRGLFPLDQKYSAGYPGYRSPQPYHIVLINGHFKSSSRHVDIYFTIHHIFPVKDRYSSTGTAS